MQSHNIQHTVTHNQREQKNPRKQETQTLHQIHTEKNKKDLPFSHQVYIHSISLPVNSCIRPNSENFCVRSAGAGTSRKLTKCKKAPN